MSNEAAGGEVRIEKVISGGQTGVDRAALDAAMSHGVDVGGWCPHGRCAEDGRIDDRYPLRETPSPEYAERTAWNVRDSDGTLIIAVGDLAGGTSLTLGEARRWGKPRLVVNPTTVDVEEVRDWMRGHAIRVLNVAGPRESEAPGMYRAAHKFLSRVLGGL